MGTSEPRETGSTRPGGHEDRRRETNRPAFVLHSYPWKETSLVVELFTRSHGRIPAVAKGARRPHSALRGLLMAFQPDRSSPGPARASCACCTRPSGAAACRS